MKHSEAPPHPLGLDSGPPCLGQEPSLPGNCSFCLCPLQGTSIYSSGVRKITLKAPPPHPKLKTKHFSCQEESGLKEEGGRRWKKVASRGLGFCKESSWVLQRETPEPPPDGRHHCAREEEPSQAEWGAWTTFGFHWEDRLWKRPGSPPPEVSIATLVICL